MLLGFAAASLTLAMMPGPDNIYVLTESISKGWRQGVAITTGLISGVIIHTTLVATGFSLIVFQYEWAFIALKLAGTIYLLYMVYGAIREKPIALEAFELGERQPFSPLFWKGFLMNVLNPKVTLFFMVLLPQFVTPNGWSPMLQMMVLGGIFMIVSFPVFSGIALLAGKLSALVKSPKFWAVTKWLKVTVLLILAALMIMAHQ
jgi:threonine/homoserine/homoserine lactone efflux protein